ncbi:accessory factor UbiK family protein [Bacterioplanoides sp. SCSIO 12839]|uniref:accessory factor UbiK family protein n=1 Tax=Bacterioplanoides sp. SCSIO 12839 TaxID=2829569 RepID=UPI00210348CA|nr:accessory factor UbiK family protein [Bacterioplanoides sp. SCSIO 12839]UTW48148.1 accessory factor UbiK family protein [Bacterioplanoides sp. SCSIO 12839]
MINPAQIKQMADEFLEKLPTPGIPEDMKLLMRGQLQSMLTNANLVTREEFDVQLEVLRRTQAQLVELEQRLAELEKKAD